LRYTRNGIFTVIRNAVKAEIPGANVTMTYSPTPTVFPTVFVREIGRFTPTQTAVFSNQQDISEITWEAQVFSNVKDGAKEQAYDLMEIVDSAFRSIYFIKTFESPVEQGDKTRYCLVARYRRVVGSGESMPTNS